MAYQDLSVAEMIQISSYWITPPGTIIDGKPVPTYYPLLMSSELLRGIIPYIERAHHDLLTFSQKKEPAIPPEVKEIEDEQGPLDVRHDILNRFVHDFLDLAALLASPALREKLVALKRKLFPDGLQVVKYNFSREAGAARLLEGRLQEEDKNLLSAVSIQLEGNTFTLLDLVLEFIEKAKRLGDLEEMKEEILRNTESVIQATERKLAMVWINRVITLERMVSTAEDISEEDKKHILGTLHKLEREAADRARRREEREAAKKKQTPPQAPAESTE